MVVTGAGGGGTGRGSAVPSVHATLRARAPAARRSACMYASVEPRTRTAPQTVRWSKSRLAPSPWRLPPAHIGVPAAESCWPLGALMNRDRDRV